MAAARKHFADVSLLCLDEFELDDPGNTLIVKRFIEGLFEAGGSLVTTSNTPPEAQGRGRFNAEDFRREIQGIASRFQTISLQGSDYRRRERPPRLLRDEELTRARSTVLVRPLLDAEFSELLDVLRRLHPIRYRSLLARIGALFIRDVEVIRQQGDALRFVHFVDQLYDRKVGLRASGDIGLAELFDDSYRDGAYQKKHERCVSRLGELLEEPLGVQDAQDEPGERAEGFY
jgi:cell division protein ZapE